MTPYEIEPITATLNKMKLLLWRLDLSKQTFINRNACSDVVLSAENYRFFKDRTYREKLLHTDDLINMGQAINSFKQRKPVQMVFRVQTQNRTHWYKLEGWPADDYRYYDGVVEEISGQINELKNIFEQQNRQLLEHAEVPYPVALFLWPSCTLQKANLSFVDLLSLETSTKRKIQLSELLRGDINLPSLLEAVISGRHITTELSLATKQKKMTRASCRLEHFSHAGQHYLRLAVLEPNESNSLPAERKKRPSSAAAIAQLSTDLSACWSIEEMLDRIYQVRELFPRLDAVMFSDIYARKNQVVVYSKGELKEPLVSGTKFPYAGTIAENIANENLEYLIVDNTQSSIKAIDWMLFVPQGVYSYIAKALYMRGAIRTVLIFCSKQKNSFSEHQVADVTAIAVAFHNQIKKIRRQTKLH